MSSYTEGFNLGYKASAPIKGISEGIEKFNKEYLRQQEIGRQRQKDFDDARKAFRQQQEETYGKYAKEDLYDDTGFTDFDSLGDKFTRNAKDLYRLNEFAYRNGFIDETELTSRNNTLRNQSQKLTTLYDEANEFIAEKKRLDDEGKSNPLNDLKLEMLEEYSSNAKIIPSLDGLYMSTLTKDGNQRNISISDFNRVLTSESGLDLNSVYDQLLDNQGFTEYLSSGNTKKITTYTTEEGPDMDALDVQLSAMTEGQQLGALLDIRDRDGNKIATSDKKEAEDKGLIYVGHDRAVEPSITKEEQNKLKEAMVGQLRALQERKQKEEIYRDPYKTRETASQKGKKDKMDASFDLALQATSGGEMSQNAVNKIKSINDEVVNVFGGVDDGVFVIQKRTKDGLQDITVDIVFDKDGNYNHKETAKAIYSVVDPSANPGEAETAAEIYAERHPNYEYSTDPKSFGEYSNLPSADTRFLDEGQTQSVFDKAYGQYDDYIFNTDSAVEDMRESLIKGYGLSEADGYSITKKSSGYLGGKKEVIVETRDGKKYIFDKDMGRGEFLSQFNEMVKNIAKQKAIGSKKSTDQSSKNFG